MYVCVKKAYHNSATNIKVSIFILYSIISTSFDQICHLYCCLCNCTKRLVLPIVLCLSDASLVIADNCNALGLIPLPARRSVSACLISYVNYRGTCKVSDLSLFVTQFRSRVGRFESSTDILSIPVILVSKS